jgi:anion-transporting  ArsA/GET3 family ATPase
MLDTKQSWDDLIARHAPDWRTRDEILANPLYQNITGKFVQSHDYVAMERLYEIHTSGRYDLIVVDTPPTRNAVDFLDAPERMADFFSSKLLRWIIAPYRSKVVSFASKPFYSVADRILGTQFLQDIAEFFILFQSMYDGFVERADAVQHLLASPSTSFVVVSTLEAAPAREAQFFLDLLGERKLHVGALVLNKVLPDYLLDRGAATAARRMVAEADELAAGLTDVWGDLPFGRRILDEIGTSFVNYQLVAQREAELRSEMSVGAGTVATVPYFSRGHRRPGRPPRVGRAVVALDRLMGPPQTDLLASRSTLDDAALDHLGRLMREWAMLADFCFSDLVLYVLDRDGRYLMAKHIRPATSQTIYQEELVGQVRTPEQRPLIDEAFRTGGHPARRHRFGVAG